MKLHKERLGWYFYDWANSACATSVVTVFFGPYITSVVKAAADAQGYVYPLGIPVHAGSFFPYMVSLSVLLQVIVLPILGALADYSHRKKQLLGACAYIGASAVTAMFFVENDRYLLGGILFLIANVSFGASIVVYNAFLSDVAKPEERDNVSSKGFAWGYAGGGVLLAINLLLFNNAQSLGIDSAQAVRINLALAGLWWGAFSLLPMVLLRNRQPVRTVPEGRHYLTIGFRQLRNTLAHIPQYPQTFLFLGAFLLYNEGIQTVITLSSQFGQEELNIPLYTLTVAILMVQFIAVCGALLFNSISAKLGSKRTLMITLVIWMGAVLYAYAFLQTTAQFFVLAGVIALVLGGSQALSRSLFSRIIPEGKEAEYFSIYELSDRGTSWLGPLSFGLALQFTGSYRLAILSLVVFFALGLALLSYVKRDTSS